MDILSYIMIVLGVATAARWITELIDAVDNPGKKEKR